MPQMQVDKIEIYEKKNNLIYVFNLEKESLCDFWLLPKLKEGADG